MAQNPNMDKLLNMAGKKLGKDPGALQNDLQQGKLDSLLGGLSESDSAKLQSILQNPKVAQQFLNTPQAQQMLKKLMEK